MLEDPQHREQMKRAKNSENENDSQNSKDEG